MNAASMTNAAWNNWMPSDVLSYLAGLSPFDLSGPERRRMYLLAKATDSAPSWISASESGVVRSLDARPEEPLVQLATRIHDFGGEASFTNQVGKDEALKLTEATSHPHVLFDIQKRRDGAAFLSCITVGRTRNHDVVLRDGSVSKYHASLEVHDDGTVEVRDRGSKNHTLINGERIERGVARPGDDIQFGSIKTILCTAEGLWRCLKA